MINPSNFMVYNRLQSEFQLGEWEVVIREVKEKGYTETSNCSLEELDASKIYANKNVNMK